MSVETCSACWRFLCTCPEGHGWLRLEIQELLQISAALQRAIARKMEERKGG